MHEFKTNIKEKIDELNTNTNNDNNTNNNNTEQMEKFGQLMQFIYDYKRFELNKDDFLKRTRIKSNVCLTERCCAKRANGEQCTRRKKVDDEYCGTHMKGLPHGIVDEQNDNKQQTQKVEVWAQDIQGIIYYIDKSMNVYQAEDIVNNITNPKIIAKYVNNEEIFSIPEFGI